MRDYGVDARAGHMSNLQEVRIAPTSRSSRVNGDGRHTIAIDATVRTRDFAITFDFLSSALITSSCDPTTFLHRCLSTVGIRLISVRGALGRLPHWEALCSLRICIRTCVMLITDFSVVEYLLSGHPITTKQIRESALSKRPRRTLGVFE